MQATSKRELWRLWKNILAKLKASLSRREYVIQVKSGDIKSYVIFIKYIKFMKVVVSTFAQYCKCDQQFCVSVYLLITIIRSARKISVVALKWQGNVWGQVLVQQGLFSFLYKAQIYYKMKVFV